MDKETKTESLTRILAELYTKKEKLLSEAKEEELKRIIDLRAKGANAYRKGGPFGQAHHEANFIANGVRPILGPIASDTTGQYSAQQRRQAGLSIVESKQDLRDAGEDVEDITNEHKRVREEVRRRFDKLEDMKLDESSEECKAINTLIAKCELELAQQALAEV